MRPGEGVEDERMTKGLWDFDVGERVLACTRSEFLVLLAFQKVVERTVKQDVDLRAGGGRDELLDGESLWKRDEKSVVLHVDQWLGRRSIP